MKSNEVSFILNGREVSFTGNPLSRLLDVLRNNFQLTGAKEGCGEGECGACAVLLNGKMVNSCLIPMAYVGGREITTVEGINETKEQQFISEGFAEAGAVQCGFCTPGMVMAAYQLLKEDNDPSLDEVKEAISGNLCRCTGYQMIVNGILIAGKKMRDAE